MKRKNQKLPSGLTEYAKQANEKFENLIEIYRRESGKISLNILVWGPNPRSATSISKKRNDIKKELIDLGHNPVFSEDLTNRSLVISEKTKEFAEALAADLIIILIEGSPGASAEFHDFCEYPELISKIYVMVPRKYKQGYSAKGAIKDLDDGYGGVYWYAEDDIIRCNILTRVVNRTEARRNLIYRNTRKTQDD